MKIDLLSKKHKKDFFDCENEILNQYLKTIATQDVKRKLSACFVLVTEDDTIVGYYTLANNSIPLNHFSSDIQRKLPPFYASIPTTLIGRLAIDKNYKGKGFGKYMLIDALKRCYETSEKVASFAVVVDPIDHQAKKFYSTYDFIELKGSGKMMIAMKTLQELFK